MALNPNDTAVEKEYVFEIHGEITVVAYSEKDAEKIIEEDLREIVSDAYRNGDIDIR